MKELSPAQEAFIQKITKQARIKLEFKVYNLQFFAALFYKFILNFRNLDKSCGGYVHLNLDIGEITDGYIHVNTQYCTLPNFTSGNLLALVIHELLHLLNKHGSRVGNRDHKTWNIAADHCCDRDLREISKCDNGTIMFSHFGDKFNIIEDLDNEQPKCTVEQAYKWIMAKQNGSNGKGGTDRFSATYDPKSGTITVKDKKSGKEWHVTTDPAKNDQTFSEARAEEARINQFCDEARALYQNLKNRGSVSNSLRTYLDEVLKVQIPWERLLEMSIKTNVSMVPDDRSWSRPNIYFRPHGLILPGLTMVETRDGVGMLVILVDTSGSINTDALKKFASVIMQSMKFFKVIRIITHDVDVQQTQDFTQDNIMLFTEWIQREGFKGRGGTSHNPVFTEVEETIWSDQDLQNDLSMVISLTDGESDIEQYYKDFNWIKNTPLVFLVTGSWTHNFKYDNISVINIDTSN